MRLVYVFDYTRPDGHVCRLPAFLAHIVCKVSRHPWDYAETESGY